MIKNITWVTPVFFHSPRGGVFSQQARELLRREGYTLVLWVVTRQDWRNPPLAASVPRGFIVAEVD